MRTARVWKFDQARNGQSSNIGWSIQFPKKFITLPEAVESVTAKIADRDIEVTRRELQLCTNLASRPQSSILAKSQK
jgi:hypothetical protein